MGQFDNPSKRISDVAHGRFNRPGQPIDPRDTRWSRTDGKALDLYADELTGRYKNLIGVVIWSLINNS